LLGDLWCILVEEAEPDQFPPPQLNPIQTRLCGTRMKEDAQRCLL
jgi:hypothetical protein